MTRNLIYTLVICCLALPGLMRAQNTLPPDAQKAFALGSAAVDQKQWDLAIRYFNEAQKAAPKNPRVLFNLGLAHSKAGHPMHAMVWLHAYLAASPKAANAEAVNKEIARLQIINDMTIAKLIQQAIDASKLLTPPSPLIPGSKEATDWYNTNYAIHTMFQLPLERSGDIEGALKIDPVTNYDPTHARVWEWYLNARAERGDVQAAQDGLNHAPFGDWLNEAKLNIWPQIYDFQLKVGDWDGANATIDLLSQLGNKYHTHDEVDRIRKAEPERRTWNALDKWLELKDWCSEDLDLEGALSKVDIPPTYFKGDATEWRKQAGISQNLLSIESDLDTCSQEIQIRERGLAWQASHPLAK